MMTTTIVISVSILHTTPRYHHMSAASARGITTRVIEAQSSCVSFPQDSAECRRRQHSTAQVTDFNHASAHVLTGDACFPNAQSAARCELISRR